MLISNLLNFGKPVANFTKILGCCFLFAFDMKEYSNLSAHFVAANDNYLDDA